MDECNKDCAYWQEGESNCKILTHKTAPKSASGNRHGLNADTKKEQARHGFTIYPKNRKTTYSQNITDYAQKISMEGNE